MGEVTGFPAGFTPKVITKRIEVPDEGLHLPDDDQFGPPIGEPITAEPPRPPIQATPFALINPLLIPPRRFLYGTHYARQYISTTGAPGGFGKSSLGVVEALALASGKPLLGIKPAERARVWIWNGEDPLEELQRRVMAAVLHYGLSADDVDGWLFLDSGRTTKIVVAEQTKLGTTINKPVRGELVQTIRANRIDAVLIDPFVSCHAVPENDNGAINAVATVWAEIADETNCAIELVHHVKKTGGNEVQMEDLRGAVALLSKARSGRVLNGMSAKEAEESGIDTPRLYFRTDNGKSNLSPPSDKAVWHHLVSVELGNGDHVGVVTPWKRRDPLDGISVSDLRKAQAEVNIGRFREHHTADDWVGHPIARALKLNLANKQDKAKVRALLRVWSANGMFKVVTDKDAKGNDRKFVVVGEWAND